MKEFRNPPDVHAPIVGYSHQIEIKGPERMLILSGQIGQRADDTVPDDPIEQLEVTLANIERNLRAANMEMRDLVKLTFYVVGEMGLGRRRAVISSWLRGHRPCMTMVFVVALATPAYKIEVDAWASREG